MPHSSRRLLAVAFILLATAAFAQPPAGPPTGRGQRGGQGRAGRGGLQRPQRDNAAPVPAGTGSIGGRVLAAETGRPVKRARVIVSGGGRPYSATTDEQGRFRITALPAASYTISATKTGFVDSIYGQRRALQAGTPIELTDGQQLANVDVKMARGGVITGRVLDEDGEPLARALVTILRQQYLRGEKQLTTAGADQSDDRGQFRIFGLPPGDYYVSATAGGLEGPLRQLLAGPGRGGQAVDQSPASTGYAPTYYPGVITVSEAARVKLAPSQESTGIDFQLQLVPLATVKGTVVGGTATVVMIPEEGGVGGGGRGGGGGGRGIGAALLGGRGGLSATARQDGTFSISNVTPGRYTIIARSDGGGDFAGQRMTPFAGSKTAVQSLIVTGEEVSVVLTPVPGVQMSGTITLEASTTAVPKNLSSFRVNPVPIDSVASMPRIARPADGGEKGQFSIPDVMGGRYLIRGNGPAGWTIKAVYVDGRDVTDQPIEVKTDNVSGINVIFSDKISRLSGTVRDSRNAGVAGLTVIAFPADDALWSPQSRQIVSARTDQAGAYKLSALPPGEYLVVALDDVEQGEWFDPAFLEQTRDKATKVTISEGDQRTQDLKAPVS
jgi:sarcosine oxidase gamma subunit